MAGRRQAQLEGSVKVVLLFLAAMHHLAVAYDHEPAVTDVRRVHGACCSVQHHHARSAAPCQHTSTTYTLQLLNINVLIT